MCLYARGLVTLNRNHKFLPYSDTKIWQYFQLQVFYTRRKTFYLYLSEQSLSVFTFAEVRVILLGVMVVNEVTIEIVISVALKVVVVATVVL